jgi:hypothetical protein
MEKDLDHKIRSTFYVCQNGEMYFQKYYENKMIAPFCPGTL